MQYDITLDCDQKYIQIAFNINYAIFYVNKLILILISFTLLFHATQVILDLQRNQVQKSKGAIILEYLARIVLLDQLNCH